MTSPSPLVRDMQERDLPAVATLSAQLGYPVPPAVLAERYHALAARPSLASFVVELPAPGVVAWMAVSHAVSLTDEPFVEILSLVVDERQRGQGLGRALVVRAEHWAVERGVGAVRVRSQIKREEAHAFYRRLGYLHRKTSHAFVKTVSGGR